MWKLITNAWRIMIKIKESSYLQYWHVYNLYGWAMSQKLTENNFEWTKDTSQCNEDFIKKIYWRKWWTIFSRTWCSIFHYLPFLPERMKIEKVEKFVANLRDKNEYIIHIRNLQQALYDGFQKKFIDWLNLIKMLG